MKTTKIWLAVAAAMFLLSAVATLAARDCDAKGGRLVLSSAGAQCARLEVIP